MTLAAAPGTARENDYGRRSGRYHYWFAAAKQLECGWDVADTDVILQLAVL